MKIKKTIFLCNILHYIDRIADSEECCKEGQVRARICSLS